MSDYYKDVAEQVIKRLNKRKGFDAWWEELSEDIQKEIIEDMSEIFRNNDL